MTDKQAAIWDKRKSNEINSDWRLNENNPKPSITQFINKDILKFIEFYGLNKQYCRLL